MKNQLLIAGIITATALLSGCSNNVELGNRVTALTNQVNELSATVDGLASNQSMMKTGTEASMTSVQDATAAANAAASEAARANARIDSIVESYKK